MRTYDTQGGGGACESLEDAERRGGNRTGKKREGRERQSRIARGTSTYFVLGEK